MLVGDDLPELGADLVAALAALDVDDLAHGCLGEVNLRRGGAFEGAHDGGGPAASLAARGGGGGAAAGPFGGGVSPGPMYQQGLPRARKSAARWWRWGPATTEGVATGGGTVRARAGA